MAAGKGDRGVLVCGTGLGMSVAANKVKGAYAALLTDVYSAQRSVLSNNATIACMGAFTIGGKLAEGHVAGVGEGLLQTLVPVGAGADDGLAADDDAAVTVVDPALRVRDGLKGRRQRHGLKDGAGGEGGGEDPV